MKFASWSILHMSVHLYLLRDNWVWPVLGCPQNSTGYCRKSWVFVFLSLPRTGALRCEDNPHHQLWALGSHLGMSLLGHVPFTIQDALVPAGETGDGTWVPFQPEYVFAYCGQAPSAFPYPLENSKANRLQRQAWRLTEMWEISRRGLFLSQGSTARASVSPLLPSSMQTCPWSIHVPTGGGCVGCLHGLNEVYYCTLLIYSLELKSGLPEGQFIQP